MGQITIEISGSFGQHQRRAFSAMAYGHADAVAQVIEWLSSEVLPEAIHADHDLHDGDNRPEISFGRPAPTGRTVVRRALDEIHGHLFSVTKEAGADAMMDHVSAATMAVGKLLSRMRRGIS